MDEKSVEPGPDEPADENISTDSPDQFDKDETNYDPGMQPPRRREDAKEPER